ncbi:MAG: hypothetical protein FWB88_05310 [Defluviitaleaceae bacterium]|nr:hypothetical protein [Defluviitaleaceae bacterium]MCL2239792.1 hypothetical protein [Defluviitaleaceae bacterium]
MHFEDALYDVLQTRRYDRLMGRTQDLWERILEPINRAIEGFFNRLNIVLPQGSGDTPVIPILFAAVGGILFAVGLFVMVRMLLQSRRPKVHDLSGIFEELAHGNYTVADLLALSENAEERRVAVRYRYIAALVALDEKDIIEISPSATNALILRGLKNGHPALARPFMEMAHGYHLAWFGYKDTNDGDFSRFCEAGDTLMHATHEVAHG